MNLFPQFLREATLFFLPNTSIVTSVTVVEHFKQKHLFTCIHTLCTKTQTDIIIFLHEINHFILVYLFYTACLDSVYSRLKKKKTMLAYSPEERSLPGVSRVSGISVEYSEVLISSKSL